MTLPPSPAATRRTLLSDRIESASSGDESEISSDEHAALEPLPRPPANPFYSLTHGPLACRRSHSGRRTSTSSSKSSARSSHPDDFASSSPTSFFSPWSSPCSQPLSMHMSDRPHAIHPSDHMKLLLSQLGSSISSSKAAFGVIRASFNLLPSANDYCSNAIKSMSEELQSLSDLSMRLHFFTQQYALGVHAEHLYEKSVEESLRLKEKQQAMLKSYEGVINRFYDEIKQRDATTEALKLTLALSMLKGEKLQKQVNALQAKLSPEL